MPPTPVIDLIAGNVQLLVSYVPHAVAIGLRVLEVRPGEVWLEIPYADKLVGNPETGVVHGGVITALLDNAAGAAVSLALPEPRSIATLDLRIDYMRPATPRRDIIGHCRCFKTTRNIAFVRGVAYHDTPDEPIATMAATFMLGANAVLPGVYQQRS